MSMPLQSNSRVEQAERKLAGEADYHEEPAEGADMTEEPAGGAISEDMPFASFEGDAPFSLEDKGKVPRDSFVEKDSEESKTYPARVQEWLGGENRNQAKGKTYDELVQLFGNDPKPVAYIPKEWLSVIGEGIKDNRIYSGKAYFIDHAVNHHPGISPEKYGDMQSVLSTPDDVKEIIRDGKRSVAFIKKIDRYNAVVVQVEATPDGRIVWHKSFFDQKKEPYAKYPSIRPISESSGGGVSPISHSDGTATKAEMSVPGSSLPTPDDVLSAGKDTKYSLNDQEKEEKSAKINTSEDPMEAINQAAEAFREEKAGRQKVTPKQMRERRAFAERQWRRAHEWAADTIEKLKLGDSVTMVDSIDELDGYEKYSDSQRNSKGWYDPESGKIVIVMGNHRSPSDVVKTILREGVAHHGLRKLFGESFDTFLDNVYNNVHDSLHSKIDELAKQHDGDTKKATEEYLGRLAENTDFERAEKQGWLQQIKNEFLNMFRKLGLKGFAIKYDTISDNELRYTLWRSYQNLAEPGRYKLPERDAAMREKLAVVVELPAKKGIEDEIPLIVRNRKDELAIEKKVGEMSLSEAQEAYKRINDSMRDENGLDLDEHFEQTKRDWIAEHGISGIGKQQADELQAAMDRYGSGMVELRWQLQDRITELGGTYESKSESKYSLIGEKGAAAMDKLDNKNRLQNRKVAEDMEKAGKDAKTIWKATGWERGKDGKWRYEIPDFKKFDPFGNLKGRSEDNGGEKTLEDYIDAPDLFAAYPELARMKVIVEDLEGEFSGWYNPNDKTISLDRDILESAKSDNDYDALGAEVEMKLTLVHEIQHAIQEIEGFSLGDNPHRLKDERLGAYYNEILDFLSPDGALRTIRVKNLMDGKKWHDLSLGARKIIEDIVSEKENIFSSNLLYEIEDKLSELEIGDDAYYRSAGEVEARNVEKRYYMNDKQKKWRNPAMTERDIRNKPIPRDEQIVYMGEDSHQGGASFSLEDEEKLNKRFEGKKSEDLFLSLPENMGEEYNEKVNELTKRVLSGRARLGGEDTESGAATLTAALIGAEIISADQGRVRAAASVRQEHDAEESVRAKTEQAVEEWAKSSGFWKSEDDLAKVSHNGQMLTKGGENRVYLSADGKTITKFNNPYKRNEGGLLGALQNIEVFNKLFPEAAYKVVGYTRDKDGNFNIVMEQPFIDGKQYDEDAYYDNGIVDKVIDYFKEIGLEPAEEGVNTEFSNEKYYVQDIHHGNVVELKDGSVVVIDANVKLNDWYKDKVYGKDSFVLEDKEKTEQPDIDPSDPIASIDRAAKQWREERRVFGRKPNVHAETAFGGRMALEKGEEPSIEDEYAHYSLQPSPTNTPLQTDENRRYHDLIGGKAFDWIEAHQNDLQSVIAMQKGILGDGVEAKDYENVFYAMNHMDGVVMQKEENYFRHYYSRINNAANEAAAKLRGDDKKRKYEDAMDEVTDYVRMKHGLERNRALFVRDNADEQATKDFADLMDALYSDLRQRNITYADYLSRMDDFIRSRVDSNYKADEHDMSGLSNKNAAGYDDAAMTQEVMNTEAELGEALTDELWDSINRATDFIMNERYESGLISKAEKERLQRQWHFYVPLKGWAEPTAEQVYDYTDHIMSTVGSPVLKRAGGRTSKSDDPLAMIGADASRLIRDAELNRVHQTAVRLARGHKGNGLLY